MQSQHTGWSSLFWILCRCSLWWILNRSSLWWILRRCSLWWILQRCSLWWVLMWGVDLTRLLLVVLNLLNLNKKYQWKLICWAIKLNSVCLVHVQGNEEEFSSLIQQLFKFCTVWSHNKTKFKTWRLWHRVCQWFFASCIQLSVHKHWGCGLSLGWTYNSSNLGFRNVKNRSSAIRYPLSIYLKMINSFVQFH